MGKTLVIIGFILSLLFFVPFAPIIGLILGSVGLNQSKKDKDIPKGLALATIIIGGLFTLINLIFVMGFMLAFMRNIFGGATEEFQQTTGEIEKQMINQMKETNTEISLSKSKIDIKIGDRQLIFLGLKNDQQDPIDYHIESIVCDPLGGTGSALSCTSGDVGIEYLDKVLTISGGDVKVLPIMIKVKTTANEGTCFCTISVNAGGDLKQTELTFDVTV